MGLLQETLTEKLSIITKPGQRSFFYWADLLVIPIVLLCSILPLLSYARRWYIYTDDSWYLLQAWNLLSGNGYTLYGEPPHPLRGPILPGALALLMIPLGRDVHDLVWAMRLLALANPLLLYFLIKRIAGFIPGLLAAALLALFGSIALLPHAFMVDSLQLSFLLLSALLLLTAAQRRRVALYALSGLFLGIAILTKESAFALIPLGFVAALLLGWNLRGVIAYYVGLALACLPWWAWVWAKTGNIYLLDSGEVKVVSQSRSYLLLLLLAVAIVALLVAAVAYRRGMFDFILLNSRRSQWVGWIAACGWAIALSGVLILKAPTIPYSLSPLSSYLNWVSTYTPLWQLSVVCIVYLIWKTLRGDRNWAFFLALCVLWIPVQALVTKIHYAPRQWMIPQALLYAALAGVVVDSFRLFLAHERKTTFKWAGALIGIVLVVWMAWGVSGWARTLAATKVNHRPHSTANQYNRSVGNMSGWITRNVPDGAGIFIGQYYRYQIPFMDGLNHRWIRYDGTNSLSKQDLLSLASCKPGSGSKCKGATDVVWIRISKSGDIRSLSSTELIQQMKQDNARYFLVTQQWGVSTALAWVPGLTRTGAFHLEHLTYLKYSSNVEKRRGLVLLKLTNKPPKPVPVEMNASTFKQLTEYVKQVPGGNYKQKIRNVFPQGIEIIGGEADTKSAQHEVQVIYKSRR